MGSTNVGDWVQAREIIKDDYGDGEFAVAEVGDVGHVLEIGDEQTLTNVYWERTGCVCGADDSELDVLCDEDFARDVANTPHKPRRETVKRGVS